MMTDAEIKSVHQHDREAFDSVANLEAEIGFTMKPGKTLYQIIGTGGAA